MICLICLRLIDERRMSETEFNGPAEESKQNEILILRNGVSERELLSGMHAGIS